MPANNGNGYGYVAAPNGKQHSQMNDRHRNKVSLGRPSDSGITPSRDFMFLYVLSQIAMHMAI